jgi:predicted dehydrogenase
MKHRVLLLGMGFWGSRWLKLIMESGRAELAGVAGSRDEISKACGKYKIDPGITFTDFREAIAKTDAGFAVVVIPGAFHFEADKLALEKGMSIISEKPLAMNIGQARELLELKSRLPERQKFMVSQNYRWRPHNRTIKKAIDDGLVGNVGSILLEFRQQEDLQGYRAGLAQPLLEDMSIHHFDLIRFFTDSDCEEIYGHTWRPPWSAYPGEPNLEAIIKMKNGVRVTYNGSWAARGKESSWDGNIAVTGDRGCITLDADDNVYFYAFEKAASVILDTREQEPVLLPKVEMAHTEMEYGFEMFMDCIERNAEPETTLEDNFKSYAMVAAAQESAKTGKPVKCG